MQEISESSIPSEHNEHEPSDINQEPDFLREIVQRVQHPETDPSPGQPNFPWKDRILRIMGIGLVASTLAAEPVAEYPPLREPTPVVEEYVPPGTESEVPLTVAEIEPMEGAGENTSFIDFPPGFDQEEVVRLIVGDKNYRSREEDFSQMSSWDHDRIRTDLAYAQRALAREYLNQFGDHGQMTTDGFLEAATRLGFPSPERPEVRSLFDAMKVLEVSRLEDGGIRMRLSLDPGIFSQMVAESNEVVVNTSAVIGEMMVDLSFTRPAPYRFSTFYHPQTDEPFYYIGSLPDGMFPISVEGDLVYLNSPDGDRINLVSEADFIQARNEYHAAPQMEDGALQLRVIEPYSPLMGEQAKENLRGVVQAALENPSHVIVTSSGNINSFFYDIRQELEQELISEGLEWPENLVITSEYFEDRFDPVSDGADVMVQDRGYLSHNTRGSSEASSITAMVVDAMLSDGYTIDTFKDALLADPAEGEPAFTMPQPYIGYEWQVRGGRLLNSPEIVQDALSNIETS